MKLAYYFPLYYYYLYYYYVGCIHINLLSKPDFAYADISNNMSFLKHNKVLSIFRSNLRMMSVNSKKKFEGKVAVVTASTDG